MAYASLADLAERYGEAEMVTLTDDARTGSLDAARVGRALADVSHVIDGYLAGRYALPLATVPDLVKTWACVLARHALHRHGAPPHVTEAYEDVMQQLRDAAAGRLTLTLPAPSGAEPPAAGGGGVKGHAAPRVFDRPALREFTG